MVLNDGVLITNVDNLDPPNVMLVNFLYTIVPQFQGQNLTASTIIEFLKQIKYFHASQALIR